MYKKTCRFCGKQFETEKSGTLYCKDCVDSRIKENRKRYRDFLKEQDKNFVINEKIIRPNKNNIDKLNSDAKAAKKCGLSYGKWRAHQYLNGWNFD